MNCEPMKVILLENVQSIGEAGTIKEVKRGYGFNFLLPRGLATIATEITIREAGKRKAKKEATQEVSETADRKRADLLTGKTVVIKCPAENGKLFGAVGKTEMSAALKAEKIEIEPNEIILKKGLKEIGVFAVSAKLGGKFQADFSVDIQAE